MKKADWEKLPITPVWRVLSLLFPTIFISFLVYELIITDSTAIRIVAAIFIALYLLTAFILWPLYRRKKGKRDTRSPASKDLAEKSLDTARGESFAKENYWFIFSVALVSLAGLLLLGDNIIYNVPASKVWHTAVIFTDVAAIGTFLSAVAGCVSAAVTMRVYRKSTSAGSVNTSNEATLSSGKSMESIPKAGGTPVQNVNASNAKADEAEYVFLREFMDNVANGKLSDFQVRQIMSMLEALKSQISGS